MNVRATFTHMEDAKAEDWAAIAGEFTAYAAALPERILAHLRLLAGDFGGFPVDRLTHSLQSATLALRDGRDEEYVICALLHDIGDTLGSYNHPDIAAAILKPFVSSENHWMIAHHGIFQGYYFFHHLGMDRHLREQFKEHPQYRQTIEFCARYDAPAFDPEAETLPLEFFEPLLRRVFARPKASLYAAAMTPPPPPGLTTATIEPPAACAGSAAAPATGATPQPRRRVPVLAAGSYTKKPISTRSRVQKAASEPIA